MKQRSKKLLGVLLTLALVLGLMPGMGVMAYAGTVQWTSGQCTLTLDDKGNMTVSGQGAMADLSAEHSPWYDQGSNIKSVNIENGVTGICSNAFAAHASNTGTNLQQVTISSSVTNIGTYAFNNCAGLTSANIESSTIGYGMFWGCTALSQVTISSNVTKIGQSAFKDCASLTQITIPSSVTEIVYDAFNGCTNLTTVTFTPAAADKTLKLGSNISGSGAKLAYGDGNTKLYDGDTLVEAGASLSDYSSKTLTWKIPVDSYPLWVGGVQVTSANAGSIDGNNKASYDAASRTLTLNGYSYTGVGYKMGSTDEACAAIYWSDSDNPLTIQLSGTNSIVRTGQSDSRYGDGAYYGIYSPGDIIIKGPATASLSVDGGDTESQGRKISYGISAKTTIQDVQVTASGTSTGISRLSAIQRANVTATGGSYGISSYTLEISENSTVTATGGSSAIYRSGPPECVKNAIPGTGWTNTEGSEGKTTIAVSTEGQDISSYKKVQFPEAAAAAATVTTAPTAKTLTYNGEAQELVTAGKAEGGTMQYYVVSADAKPDWSAGIPTATEAGTYTVWYMAKGDADHSDSEAGFVTAKITASGTAEATFDLNTGSEEHQDVEIDLNGLSVYSVSADAETDALKTGDYEISEDTLTFKKAYLSKLSVGDHAFTCYGVDGDTALLSVIVKVVDTTPAPAYYGSTETYYKVILAETENGKATASRSTAPKGATVTVTATPDEGFVLDAITAKDAKGNDVTVTDGKFTMPASDVTVTVTFKAAESEPGFATCDHGDGCILNDFSDLDPDAWYHDGVHYVLETGLMEGYGDGTFGPNDFASRAMAITLIWNMEGKPVVNFALPYSDVAQGKWYTEAVRWATSEGIVEGWTDEATGKKVFAPDADVTREQFAAMLYRYAQLHGEGFTGMWMFRLDFPDAADVSDWADEAMHWMVMQGVINGMDGKLNPQGKATRAMVATMVQRFVLGA